MKKFILITGLLILWISSFGQVRPDQFAQKTSPVATDETYSQAGGTTPVRITLGDERAAYITNFGSGSTTDDLATIQNLNETLAQALALDDSLYLISNASILPSISSPVVGDLAINTAKDTFWIRGASSWVDVPLGASGAFTGTGTPGTVAGFATSSTLEDSPITYSGTFIGINKSTPGEDLDILAGGGLGTDRVINIESSGGWSNSWIGRFATSTGRGLYFGGEQTSGSNDSTLLINTRFRRVGVNTSAIPTDLIFQVNGVTDFTYFGVTREGNELQQTLNSEGDAILKSTSGNFSFGDVGTTVSSLNPSVTLHLFAPSGVDTNSIFRLEKSGGYGYSDFQRYYRTGGSRGFYLKDADGDTFLSTAEQGANRVGILTGDPSYGFDVNADMRLVGNIRLDDFGDGSEGGFPARMLMVEADGDVVTHPLLMPAAGYTENYIPYGNASGGLTETVRFQYNNSSGFSVRGINDLSNTDAFKATRDNGETIFRANNAGSVLIGAFDIAPIAQGGTYSSTDGSGLLFEGNRSPLGTVGTGTIFRRTSTPEFGGTESQITFDGTFSPTASTHARYSIQEKTTFNQTGTATGLTGFIYGDPTLTAAEDYRFITYKGSGTFIYQDLASAKSYFAGDIGIGTSSPDSRLTVLANNDDQLWLTNSQADDVVKFSGVSMPLYDVDEEPFIMFNGQTGNLYNTLDIGGGAGNGNAATEVRIKTAATTNTLNGSVRVRVDADGDVSIGNHLPDAKLHVKGNGTTSSTTSFLIEDSSPTAIFEVKDNGDCVVHGKLYIDEANDVFYSSGTGTPEGNLSAGVGSTFSRTDGGAGTSFYVKESGTGNTGWAPK